MKSASDAPKPGALARRALVLRGLIGRAFGLWLESWLAARGWRRGDPERWLARQADFARRYTRAAIRFRGGLIKLGQVASLRVDVLPAAVSDELARLQDRVEPHPFAEIRAQVSGYLISRDYAEGTQVAKDALLFKIDPRPYQAALDQARGDLGRAQAALEKSRLDVIRYEPLAKEGAVSQQELDNAVQAKRAGEAAVLSP